MEKKKKKMIKTLSKIAISCLIHSSYEEYCKIPFEQFKLRFLCKLYYEEKNRLIRVKLLRLKIRTNLII